jgi:hypothetical protein
MPYAIQQVWPDQGLRAVSRLDAQENRVMARRLAARRLPVAVERSDVPACRPEAKYRVEAGSRSDVQAVPVMAKSQPAVRHRVVLAILSVGNRSAASEHPVPARHPEAHHLVQSDVRDDPVTAKYPEAYHLVQSDARDSPDRAKYLVDNRSEASEHRLLVHRPPK